MNRKFQNYFLQKKPIVIKSGKKIMGSLNTFFEKNAKSNRRWDEERQEHEAKAVIQREIVNKFALPRKEKIKLHRTIGLNRELDALFSQSIQGKTIAVSDAEKLVSTSLILLDELNKEHLDKIRAYNPFIKKTLNGVYKSIMNSSKRQIIPPEIVRQMKRIVWEKTSQDFGFNIYSEIEEIRKKISHH